MFMAGAAFSAWSFFVLTRAAFLTDRPPPSPASAASFLAVVSDDTTRTRNGDGQVSCGKHFFAAVTREGGLHTWGLDAGDGRLGHGRHDEGVIAAAMEAAAAAAAGGGGAAAVAAVPTGEGEAADAAQQAFWLKAPARVAAVLGERVVQVRNCSLAATLFCVPFCCFVYLRTSSAPCMHIMIQPQRYLPKHPACRLPLTLHRHTAVFFSLSLCIGACEGFLWGKAYPCCDGGGWLVRLGGQPLRPVRSAVATFFLSARGWRHRRW